PVVSTLMARMERLAADQRYEDAGRIRSRLSALLRAAVRVQRLTALTRLAQVIAARRDSLGGGGLAVVRHGRLVARGRRPARAPPHTTIAALVLTAATVPPGPAPTPAASAEETERILAWLERPEVRLVETSEGWAQPARGAARYAELL